MANNGSIAGGVASPFGSKEGTPDNYSRRTSSITFLEKLKDDTGSVTVTKASIIVKGWIEGRM